MLKVIQHDTLIYTVNLGLFTVLMYRFTEDKVAQEYYFYEMGVYVTPESDSSLAKRIHESHGDCLLEYRLLNRITSPGVHASEPPQAIVKQLEQCMQHLCRVVNQCSPDNWGIGHDCDNEILQLLCGYHRGESLFLNVRLCVKDGIIHIGFGKTEDVETPLYNWAHLALSTLEPSREVLIDFLRLAVAKYRELAVC